MDARAGADKSCLLPLRSRPARAKAEDIDGKVKMTGRERLDDENYGQMAFRTQDNRKIRSLDGCGGKTNPTAAPFGRHRHEIDANLANVGLNVEADNQSRW